MTADRRNGSSMPDRVAHSGETVPLMNSQSVSSRRFGRINRAWLEGRPEDDGAADPPRDHVRLPRLRGTDHGGRAFLAGFEDFCELAGVESFHDERSPGGHRSARPRSRASTSTWSTNGTGSTHRATGRDLWVFTRSRRAWQAVWRTMLDLARSRPDTSADGSDMG